MPHTLPTHSATRPCRSFGRAGRAFTAIVSVTLALPSVGRAQQISIDAGSGIVGRFGAPNTATYGQTLTAPTGVITLDQFTFQLENDYGHQPFSFQGYVASWNGQMMTGTPLYASLLQSSPQPAAGVVTYTFNTGGVAVTPGAQYVAFLNASPFIASNPGVLSSTNMPTSTNFPNDDYAGGKFVYMNNGSDFAALSTTPWSSFSGSGDVAFTATFSEVSTTPEPTTWAPLGTGLIVVGVVVHRQRRTS